MIYPRLVFSALLAFSLPAFANPELDAHTNGDEGIYIAEEEMVSANPAPEGSEMAADKQQSAEAGKETREEKREARKHKREEKREARKHKREEEREARKHKREEKREDRKHHHEEEKAEHHHADGQNGAPAAAGGAPAPAEGAAPAPAAQ